MIYIIYMYYTLYYAIILKHNFPIEMTIINIYEISWDCSQDEIEYLFI